MSKRGEVEETLRRAIREGRLPTGARVPATRTLAAELGVARGTVVEAYAQLAAEGWLTSRPGAPTTVSARTRSALTPPARRSAGGPHGDRIDGAFALGSPLSSQSWVHDLQPGVPDLAAFPMPAWLAALRQAGRKASASALGYGETEGAVELRRALAAYLSRARGVVAAPEQILICSGFSGALATVASAVAPAQVAMEDPGLPLHREIVARSGARVVALPVDEEGAAADPGDVAAAVVTPAHQYPLGMILSAVRRAALLDWARRTGGLLVEDDYDGEFRYDRQPISALQGLAPDHVVYVGTASKTLAPGLRLAWAVVPERFAEAFVTAHRWRRTAPVLDQLALAQLLDSGAFDRHLRRSRLVYRQRRDELRDVVESIGAPLRLRGIAAGLHAVVELPGRADEEATMVVAQRHSVGVHPLGRHWQGPAGVSGLCVGYSRPPAHAWRAALEALGSVLRESAGNR